VEEVEEEGAWRVAIGNIAGYCDAKGIVVRGIVEISMVENVDPEGSKSWRLAKSRGKLRFSLFLSRRRKPPSSVLPKQP